MPENTMDHYRRLGISYYASLSEIGSAYRSAALRYHPDKQATEREKKEHTPIFLSIKEAYDTLSDPVARVNYEREFLPELHRLKSQAESKRKLAPKHEKKPEPPVPTISTHPLVSTQRAGMVEPALINIWDVWGDFSSYLFQTRYCFRNITDLWEKHRDLLTGLVIYESVRLDVLEACDEIKLYLDDFQKHVTELDQLSGEFNKAIIRDIDRSEHGRRPEHQRMVDEIQASRDSIESWKPWLGVWNKTLTEIVQENSMCLSVSLADLLSRGRLGWGQNGGR
ncbi:hypothetical protein FKW77_004592 [Venturia effusa]|uniref:J domain-containing protein n=1 Tax=Venturia effusa TaxID=50376 RepID=A0A517LLE7_9PEZI|nr:hypothetical protein FKW77_004592 [Venturia effusa]